MAEIKPEDFLKEPDIKLTAAAKMLVFGGERGQLQRLLMLHYGHVRELMSSGQVKGDCGGMIITDSKNLYIIDSITHQRRRCDVCVDTEASRIQDQHLDDLGLNKR